MREIIPKNLQINQYGITIEPDLKDSFTFKGTVNICATVLKSTKEIILNSKELTILEAHIDNNGSRMYKIKSEEIDEDKEKERIIITLNNDLEINSEIIITIKYRGILNDEMAGFYRSKYQDSDEYMGVTQFEATDARRAFPCIDEPEAKAIFQIQLIVPNDLVALSNTSVLAKECRSDKKTIYTFKPTPIMSTYLVAFFVGKVDSIEKEIQLESGKKVLTRVFTPIGKVKEGQFALDLCGKVIIYFSEFFKIEYPLEKMDMIAIPDFAAGAMENWGLITYRSALLLSDEKTSLNNLTQVAYVICHELAHQWFGNLVTMTWWSELWLNEGFATWVGWHAVDHFFPEWKVWDTFYLLEYLRAINLDSLENSHPIEVDIDKASQVNEIFDAISYSKGACIIDMVVMSTGLENFRNGVANYLKSLKYKNATTDQLWQALSETSGKNISQLMNNWIKIKGFPRLIVNKSNIKQTKFQDVDLPINNEYIWQIPIKVNDKIEIIKDENSSVELSLEQLLNLNSEQKGFYIIDYTKEQILAGKEFVNNLESIDRASIINNLFLLSEFGYFKLNDTYDIIQQLFLNENAYLTLEILIKELAKLKSIYYNFPDNLEKINSILNSLNKNKNLHSQIRYQKIQQSYQDSLKNVLLIELALLVKDTNVISKLKELFGKDYDPNLSNLIFKAMVKFGNDEEFDKIIKKYNESSSMSEKNELLSALTNSQNKANLELLLKACFEEKNDQINIRKQNIDIVTEGLASNPIGRPIIYNYVKDNWTKIENSLSNGSFLFRKIVTDAFDWNNTPQELNEFDQFFKDKNLPSLEKTLSQIREKINKNIKLIERNSI